MISLEQECKFHYYTSIYVHAFCILKDGRVHYYDVEYKGFNEDTKLVELGGLGGRFSEAVSKNTHIQVNTK